MAIDDGVENNLFGHCTSESMAIFGFAYYAVIFCLGVFGNSFVISTVYRRPELQTPFNFLIVNLASSDLCVVFFSVPIVVFSECFSWPMGELSCRLSRPFFFVFSGVSVGTMVTLSFERQQAVVTPLAPKLNHKKAKLFIALIWVLSILGFGLPKSFLFRLKHSNSILECAPKYPNTVVRLIILIWILCVTSVLPCAAVCWAYKQVMRYLKRELVAIRSAGFSGKVENLRAKRNSRMMKLVVTVVFVFIFCYTPFNILILLNGIPAYASFSYNESIENISWMLQVTHSCINPMILCLMSSDFRRNLKALFSFNSTTRERMRIPRYVTRCESFAV